MSGIKDVDSWRKFHLAIAEFVDAWRLVPRIIVVGYAYLLWYIVDWYMKLEPYMIEGCTAEDMTKCLAEAPSTQHAALVTAVVGVAAAVFGLYANSGKKWNGFSHWNKQDDGAEMSWRTAEKQKEKESGGNGG